VIIPRVVSLSRAWTTALAIAVFVAAAAAGYAAWEYRRLVGFESGWTCTLDPAWRIQLAWWLTTAAALLLLSSALALLHAITGRGDGRVGLPLPVCAIGVGKGHKFLASSSFIHEVHRIGRYGSKRMS
jgi:hypothetical protein